MDREDFERVLDIIRSALARGLSPYEISTVYADKVGVSAATLYRWIERGYGGMANIELKRKVGFAPRNKKRIKAITHHGQDRSFEAFSALPEEEQAGAIEMDTVIGRKRNQQCILTLYARPSHFQLYVLLAEKTCDQSVAALDRLEGILGLGMFKEVFGLILTDNGTEIEDAERLEASATVPGGEKVPGLLLRPKAVAAKARLREEPH
jgi:IS30 family transposase